MRIEYCPVQFFIYVSVVLVSICFRTTAKTTDKRQYGQKKLDGNIQILKKKIREKLFQAKLVGTGMTGAWTPPSIPGPACKNQRPKKHQRVSEYYVFHSITLPTKSAFIQSVFSILLRSKVLPNSPSNICTTSKGLNSWKLLTQKKVFFIIMAPIL